MERGDPHRWKNRQGQKEATRQAPPTHPLLVCCRGTYGSVGIISPSKIVISRWGWRLRSVIQLDTRRLEEKDGKFKVWLDCSASSKLSQGTWREPCLRKQKIGLGRGSVVRVQWWGRGWNPPERGWECG